MPDEFDVLKGRLREQNMTVALRHLELATIAFERREWESSNAQLRSFLEALFNEVASLRLDSTKRGGAARKALEDAGLLREKEARLVQAFMAVAGGEGSHAGVSNEDEAQGRFWRNRQRPTRARGPRTFDFRRRSQRGHALDVRSSLIHRAPVPAHLCPEDRLSAARRRRAHPNRCAKSVTLLRNGTPAHSSLQPRLPAAFEA